MLTQRAKYLTDKGPQELARDDKAAAKNEISKTNMTAERTGKDCWAAGLDGRLFDCQNVGCLMEHGLTVKYSMAGRDLQGCACLDCSRKSMSGLQCW